MILMTLKPILILTIFLVILVGGCVQQVEETENDVEKTSLLSFIEFFCGWTERSKHLLISNLHIKKMEK